MRNTMNQELPPPACSSLSDSREILRCWASEGQLHVTLRPAIGNPEERSDLGPSHAHASAWGSALYDISRQVANALAGDDDDEYFRLLQRQAASFQAEVIAALQARDGVE